MWVTGMGYSDKDDDDDDDDDVWSTIFIIRRTWMDSAPLRCGDNEEEKQDRRR